MVRDISADFCCYTIGHSNHEYEKFFSLLMNYGVQCLVDVRSSPYSRYARWFDKIPCRRETEKRGLRYCYEGESLGGFYHSPVFKNSDGSVDYGRVRETASFREALRRLVELIRTPVTVVLMCAEKDPCRCHRFLLDGSALQEKGIDVFHILEDGRAVAHTALEQRMRAEYNKKNSQMKLFEAGE